MRILPLAGTTTLVESVVEVGESEEREGEEEAGFSSSRRKRGVRCLLLTPRRESYRRIWSSVRVLV